MTNKTQFIMSKIPIFICAYYKKSKSVIKNKDSAIIISHLVMPFVLEDVVTIWIYDYYFRNQHYFYTNRPLEISR